MSSIDTAIRPSALSARLFRHAPAIYAATLFVSALLLFSIQPMFAKMVLPKLGGALPIWFGCDGVLSAALLSAPMHTGCWHLRRGRRCSFISVFWRCRFQSADWYCRFNAPPSSGIEIWLLCSLPRRSAAVYGPWQAPPAALVRAERSPQANHSDAASNSLFAALSSQLIELLSAAAGGVWSAGFALLAILVAVAALVVASGAVSKRVRATRVKAPTMAAWLSWIALAAVPAGLVVAVTAHISTDVAAAPFLWVVPLALYLLTFVAVFRETPWIAHETVARIAPFVIAACDQHDRRRSGVLIASILHLIAFFVATYFVMASCTAGGPIGWLTDFIL
jgi:hypothetical protein